MFSLTPIVHYSHLLFLPKSSGFFPARIPASSFTVRSSSSLQEVEKFSESSSERKELSSELYASIPLPPIKTAKRVVLVRHGQSTWNAEGRIQGSSNFSVLTKKGEAQAETSRQMLIDDAFDVCFSRYPILIISRHFIMMQWRILTKFVLISAYRTTFANSSVPVCVCCMNLPNICSLT